MTGRSGWIIAAASRALGHASDDRRSGDRVTVAGLWCDRGQIIDLSPRGMRMMSFRRWHEGQERRVTIADGKHSATVIARCVWCRQDGLFSHQMGLAFESIGEDDVRAIELMLRKQAAA